MIALSLIIHSNLSFILKTLFKPDFVFFPLDSSIKRLVNKNSLNLKGIKRHNIDMEFAIDNIIFFFTLAIQ